MKFFITSATILILSAVLVIALPAGWPKPKKVQAKPNINAPVVSKLPTSQVVTQGNTIKLSVTANNPNKTDKVLKYQWSKNGKMLAGATNFYITFSNVQYTNQGLYSVSVANTTGTTTIQSALTVPTTNILSACIVSNTVNLSWNYDFTNNPDVSAFKIFYGTNDTNYGSNIVVDKTNLTTKVSDLLSGNTFYFMAIAISTNGIESSPSEQLSQSFGYFCGIPYKIDIIMLPNNTPRLTTKLCPNCVVGIQRTQDFTKWTTIGATTADKYGNIIFDDHSAPGSYGFYRLITQ